MKTVCHELLHTFMQGQDELTHNVIRDLQNQLVCFGANRRIILDLIN